MPIFCSQESLRVDEPLAGTAPKGLRRYLLLEFPGVWPNKAWEGIEIPAATRAAVDAAVAGAPNTRLQLIRRSRDAGSGPRMMVADVVRGTLEHFQFPDYDAIASFDLAAALTGALGNVEGPSELWLTCTHSRRDRCCAKFGLPVQAALLDAAGESAWQASHVGGHRFAPNVLLLPHGIMLGRVAPSQVADLVARVRDGALPPLRNWRGRVSLPQPAQAAEIAARLTGATLHPGCPEIEASEEVDGGREITLRFRDAVVTVPLERVQVGPFAKSCGDEPVQLFGWKAA